MQILSIDRNASQIFISLHIITVYLTEIWSSLITCVILLKSATFLQRVVKVRAGLDTLEQNLDDFILVGRNQIGDCKKFREILRQIWYNFGIPLVDNFEGSQWQVLFFLPGLKIYTMQQFHKIPSNSNPTWKSLKHFEW